MMKVIWEIIKTLLVGLVVIGLTCVLIAGIAWLLFAYTEIAMGSFVGCAVLIMAFSIGYDIRRNL